MAVSCNFMPKGFEPCVRQELTCDETMDVGMPLLCVVIEFELEEPDAAGDESLKISTAAEFSKGVVDAFDLELQGIVGMQKSEGNHLGIFLFA